MPSQTTSMSAISTTDDALSIPLLLQPEVGGLVDPLSVNRQNQSSRSLLFVDGGVADYQTLVAGVSSGTEVHILDSSQDAVTQITNTLLGRNGISSLHIVSHGEAGGLDFGTGKLNLSDLPEYAAQLQSWSKALTDDADILLYGCNVAQGELGKAFTSILSQLTGADIAASDNVTGTSALGGDWDLEYQTGSIAATATFTSEILQFYKGILAILNGGFETGDLTGWSKAIESGSSGDVFVLNSTTLPLSSYSVPIAPGGSYAAVTDQNSPGSYALYQDISLDANSSHSLSFKYFVGNRNGSFVTPNTLSKNTTNQQFRADIMSTSVIDFFGGAATDGVLANITQTLIGSTPVFSDYQAVTFNLDSFAGQTIRLAFRQAVQQFFFQIGIDDVTLTSTPLSASPIIDLPSSNLSYAENSNALLVDPGATVADGDSANFDTGTLTANFSANGTVDDQLAIRNQGTAAGEIGVSGSNITFGGIQIGTFTGGMGTTPLVVTFNSSSSPDAAQALLRNLAYSNVSEAPSTVDRTVSLVLTDGDGGTSATANKTITVVAVNDAPTVTAPAAIAVTEDITATLSGISFADVDAGDGIVIASLSVGAGTLAATTGSDVTVGGTATNLTLSGTLAAINSFIAGNNLTYTTDLNATANQTLSVSLNDGGNTGGEALSSTANVALNVTAVNDAPTVTAPSAIAVAEDVTTTLTGISFADVDAGSGSVTATLTVGAGTLAATTGGGVTVGGTATNRTLSGTLAAINSFMAGNNLTYTTSLNATANQTLSVSLNDGGNTGGEALSSTANVALNVTAVNDAPTVTAPSAIAVAEDVTTTLSGISFADVDAGNGSVTATLSVGAGTLAATTGSGVTVGGTATNRTLTGTLAAINSFMAGNNLTYTTALNDATTQTLSVSLNDNGNTGTGGPLASAVTTVTLNVAGTTNLLWRNGTTGTAPTGTGQNAVWQLKDFTRQNDYYIPAVADLNWQIVSTADFNRDGNADILWRNGATGENSVWLMNSTGFQTSYYLPPVADANWRIIATDDFTGDGTADLVWRNGATGENSIWQMNSTGFQTSYYINPVADANWQIVSTADFNADGIADLLWRNRATGENSIWQLNSTGFQTSYYINPVGDANWQVVGTADMNNDGIADIVWRNRATGENSLWQMNSTGLQTSYYINPVADANWQIVGVANLGGNSTPDLLWRNAATGQTDIWQLSEFSFVQSYQLPTAASEWSVRPFTAA